MDKIFASILCYLSLLAPAKAEQITVFAAASLQGALTEIVQAYDTDVTLSFAGSGTVARQVAAGAPVDAVVLAHRDWAAWLSDEGHILSDSLREIAGGQLVVIGTPDTAPFDPTNSTTLLTALNGGRLAMGQRDGVPAGSYARDWLRHIGAWDALSPHLAETDNVRAALALVAQRAAPLGVVYASDAVAEPRVKVLYAIPHQFHAPIRYPAAAVTQAGLPFVDHLTSDTATAIFTKHGFAPLTP